MPSARPKLVQGGGEPVKSDDIAVKTADNLYVIGGSPPPATLAAAMNSGRSSLSMHVSSSGGMDLSMNEGSSRGMGSSRRGSTGTKKGGSSLARAAKGTFISEKKVKRKAAVQTSFVVGGNAGFQDEKKSPEMADSRKSTRSSVTSTSFQVPDNGHTSFSSLAVQDQMDVDTSARGRRKSRTSTVQPTSFVVGGAPPEDINDNNNMETVDISDAVDISETMDAVHIGETMDATPNTDTMDVTPTTPSAAEIKPEEETKPEETGEVEKMEGVIDLSEKPPLCVLDGANLAYAYAKAGQGGSSLSAEQSKPDPDTKGIEVACNYFESAGIRVLAVLPQTWTCRENHQKVLKRLEAKGFLVESPSRDDDDAYSITIARREDAKAQKRGDGPGYVMSNDMFRDAQARSKKEGGGDDLKIWLTEGSTLESGKTGPGRISFAFLDTGSLDDHGDKVLDIMPNPRHPLIQHVERKLTKSTDQ